MLASVKRGGPGESKVDGAFKVPRERVTSVASSMDEEEAEFSSGIDELGSGINNSAHSYTGRRYRETSASKTSHSGTFFTLNSDS